MQAIQSGYNGLSLILALNLDRIIVPLAIIIGLVGGAMLGSLLIDLQPVDAPAIH